MPLRVLVACEMSGRVRDAFAVRGWEAWSADLLPSETPVRLTAFPPGDPADAVLGPDGLPRGVGRVEPGVGRPAILFRVRLPGSS